MISSWVSPVGTWLIVTLKPLADFDKKQVTVILPCRICFNCRSFVCCFFVMGWMNRSSSAAMVTPLFSRSPALTLSPVLFGKFLCFSFL